MSKELAITPRNLGAISLPRYCPKCFRFLLDLKFQPPFKSFGAAIFNDAQKSQEAIIGYYLAKDGRLPKAFAPFCDCAERAEFPRHWSKFSYVHKSGVKLYGAPDEIFVRADGSLCVVDLKTAHFRGDDDPFHSQYVTQVVGYANIAEGLELGKVTLGGLLYWDARTDNVIERPSDHFESGTLWMPFKPKGQEVEIDYKILDPLLTEAKKVWEAKDVPEGREDCDDCKKRELLFAIDQRFERELDSHAEKYKHIPEVRNNASRRKYQRRYERIALLSEFESIRQEGFASDGLMANWEFDPPE